MQFHLLLEGLNLCDPGRWIFRLYGEQMIPPLWGIHGCQLTKELDDPICVCTRAEPLADPVAFRIGGATGVGFHQARAIETHG